MVINNMGDSTNEVDASTWGNLRCGTGDIIEYNSTTSKWGVVFDASNPDSTQHYVTNTNTGIQYRFNGTDWIKSYEGIYAQGKWTLVLSGGSSQYNAGDDVPGQSGSGSNVTY